MSINRIIFDIRIILTRKKSSVSKSARGRPTRTKILAISHQSHVQRGLPANIQKRRRAPKCKASLICKCTHLTMDMYPHPIPFVKLLSAMSVTLRSFDKCGCVSFAYIETLVFPFQTLTTWTKVAPFTCHHYRCTVVTSAPYFSAIHSVRSHYAINQSYEVSLHLENNRAPSSPTPGTHKRTSSQDCIKF